MRRTYYNMAMCEEAKAKSIFMTPPSKSEFTQYQLGLAQVPAYFQQLMYKVLRGLDFAISYSDDIYSFQPLHKNSS